MKRGVLGGVLLLTIACWCGGAAADPSISPDVIYGHKDGMALTYDVFSPEKANGAGVVYMVSGGWFSVWREPAQQLTWFEPLLDEGFTVFAVRHGSAPRFKVPDAVSDVRAAVRHIRHHAAAYGVDPGRLGVWGGSAGGHLSLMLAFDPENGPDAGGEGPRAITPKYAVGADGDGHLAAVVAFYPPVDLRSRAGPSERFPALDFPREAAAAISPILFVDAGDPPTLLVHGDADELVPLADSEAMNAALEKAGVTHDMLVIEGGVHGFRDPERRARATRAMVDWFRKYLLR